MAFFVPGEKIRESTAVFEKYEVFTLVWVRHDASPNESKKQIGKHCSSE